MDQPKAASPRQIQLLKLLVAYIDSRGYAPSRREMAELLCVSSTNTIQGLLSKLKELGFVRTDGAARALVVTAEGKAALL